MKTYVSINGQKIEAAIYGLSRDTAWNDRESKEIVAPVPYEQAKSLFVDDVPWSIVQEEDDGTSTTYDNSDFCAAGPITDNRDGTVSVKMGKPTAEELLNILMEGRA